VSPADEFILELRGIHAAYERIEVLHGVDLAMRAGSVLAVLGPNGAGKTTMLSVVAGLLRPTHGDVMLAGRRVNGARPDELARRGLCMVPEGKGVFPNLSVRENLVLATHTGASRSEIEDRAFTRFPALAARRAQLAGTLSGGEQQMLAMARGLATEPSVLLLDELSMGLAPLIVENLFEKVAEIAHTGVSVLVVEQFAKLVLDVADEAAIMVQGRVAVVGTPNEVAAELSTAYLGG
jgi:branched-chain amino acid transport system ATP-binding protein